MKDFKDWSEEYTEFCQGKGQSPDPARSILIREQIERALNPSALAVFLKVFRVVLLVGLLTLAICPQFGIGFIRDSQLFHFFMMFGHSACKSFCGAFFLGLSLFVAAFCIKAEDLRVLRQHRLLEVLVLSLICLSAFVAAGAKVFLTMMLFWIAGSISGGLLAIELANYISNWRLLRV